ncbi:hypothetical protein [Tardiphaga sp. 768_D3_N2_1]|uniref:hypothetical protein n=1 Tax=Tardiphaga sp. 768_D3_N2_1 TaxID=3240783 RepID=UPI003F8BB041
MGRPNAFDGMMHEFCAKLGWCGHIENGKPLHVSDFIPETGHVTAEDFVQWLIIAEGLTPEQLSASEVSLLKAVFVRHLGTSAVDAHRLRSNTAT